MRIVLVDGVDKPDGKVVLDAQDLALERGWSAFETLRTYGGVLFRVAEHHARMCTSLEILGMPPVGYEVFASELEDAVRRLPTGPESPLAARSGPLVLEAVVRMTLTWGGRRIVLARPLPAGPRSVAVVRRPCVPIPGVSSAKHGSRLPWEMARRWSGADEVLWEDPSGLSLEGTWSNVFAVRDGVLCTPPADGRILAGITRGALLEAAAEIGVPTAEGPLRLDEPVDELYLSSSLKELVPVVSLDARQAPGEGPVGRRVMGAFRALVARETAGG